MNRPKPVWILILFCAFIGALTLCPSLGFGQELAAGTNSRKAKEQATSSIPFQQLTAEAQAKIKPIIQRSSIYRRLPITSIDIDPDYYLFLIRHPEVVINIWQLMGVTEMTAERIAAYQLATDDGAGTLGDVELIYGTNNMHIYYGEGEYNGSVLAKKLRGKIVIILKSEYQLNAEGKTTATSQMDIFVKIENATLGLIAKTLHPIIGTTADHNFTESINFLQRLNETTVNNGPGVQGMAHRLETLTPEVKKEFVQVAGLVYDRAIAGVQHGSRAAQEQTAGLQQNPYDSNNSNRYNTQARTPETPASLQRAMPMQQSAAQNYSRRTANGNPNPQYSRTGFQSNTRQPVQESFGDRRSFNNQGQTPNYSAPPVYSTSRGPYSTNPYYNNR